MRKIFIAILTCICILCSSLGASALTYASNDISELNTNNYTANYYTYRAELIYRCETHVQVTYDGGQFVILGKSGGVPNEYQISWEGPDEFNLWEEDNTPSYIFIELPDDTKEHILNTISGDAEYIHFGTSYSGKYIMVDADSATGAMFNPNDAVAVYGNEGDFELSIADDDYDTIYTVTGSNEGDIYACVSEDIFYIEGENLNGAAVNWEEGNSEWSYVIDEDMPYAYLAIEDGQLTVLSEDEVPNTFSTTTDTDTDTTTDSDTSTDADSSVGSDTDTATDTDTTTDTDTATDTAGSSSDTTSKSTSSANNSVSVAESTAVSSDTAQSGDARGVAFFFAAAATALAVAVLMFSLTRKQKA